MSEGGPFRRLLQYMAPHRGTIRLATFCSVLNKIWDLAPPLLIGLVVDVVVLREESFLAGYGYENPWHQLILLSILTFMIWGLESLFEYFYGILWRNLAQTVQHELRLETFGHVQKQGMGWFDERQKGDILAILNDDINQLERFLDKGANDFLQVSTTVIVVGAVFLAISWKVALFAVLPIPIIVWGSFLYQRSLEPRYADVRNTAGRLNALLENDLSGMSTIQSFTAEERELKRVEALSEEYREANKKAIRLSVAFVPMIRMAILCGFTATLLLGGWLTLEGTLAIGAYSVLVFMTQRLLWPLTRLGETFDLYQRAMASSTRVLDVLTSPTEIKQGDFKPEGSSIADSNIWFWAKAVASERRLEVEVSEPDVSPMAIQGPKSDDVVASVFGDWVRELKYFWFRESSVEGIPVVVARSGWSKQGGFEIYLLDGSQGTRLWEIFSEAGKPWDIGPGNPNLTERIESGLLSWGGDTDEKTNPFEVRMGKYMDLDLSDEVIGIEALQKIHAEGPRRHQLGLIMEGEEPMRPGFVWNDIMFDRNKIGDLTNNVWSRRLGKNIGFALVSTKFQPGDEVKVNHDDQSIKGKLVELPFL